MVPFGELLRQGLADRGLSLRTFATRVGRSHTFVSRVLGGLRLPPLADLDAWFNALKVNPDERDRLRLAAHLTHCPKLVVDHLQRTQTRLDKALADVTSLRDS